ncbi:MAG: hypothetical protein RLZZ630_1090 [Bacteroidota bacterium]
MKLVVVNDSRSIAAFHALPFRIYENDPQWIPYIKQEVEKVFSPDKNKLYGEGAEAIRWVLENDKGEVIGRVAAFINPRTSGLGKFKTGGMGFFECINDQKAANLLFDACRNWLKERGCEAMDGPINFGDRDRYWGCQVTNWEEGPIYPMNYNPPYYPNLFEQYGFGIYFKQFLYWRSVHEKAQPIFHRKFNQLKEDPDFQVTNIRGMKLSKVAEDFRTVYNAAWGGHSHFKEMSASAAQKIMKALAPVLDRDIVIFAYHKDKPIGFYVSIPELNQLFRFVNGNLNWLGKLKFLYYQKRKIAKRMTGLVFGVVREWQGKGVEAAMIVFAEKTIVPVGVYDDTVLTWIGDFNPKMIKVAENLGTTLWRTLQTYRYQFDRSLPFERAPVVD